MDRKAFWITCQDDFAGYIIGRDLTKAPMAEIKSKRRRPPKFELIAGNLCLDFINTLDDRPSEQPKELLPNYFELARFGEDTGILTPNQLDFFHERIPLAPEDAEETMRRARKLRE